MKTSNLSLLLSFVLCTCVLAPQNAGAQTNLSFSYPSDYISDVVDVHVDAAGTGFLGGTCGVLRSTTDNGQNWLVVSSPTNDDIEAIACPPGGCATALLATDNALYRLNDGVWTEVTYVGYEEGGNLHWLSESLVVHEAGASGLWRSTDDGASWTRIDYNENKSSELAFADANTGYFFANDKLFKTTDGGASFAETGYTHPNNPYYLAWLDSDTGWSFDGDRKFWKTVDGGNSWAILNDEQQLSTINWFTPITADHLVAAQGLTTAESFDGGVTWARGQFGVDRVNGTGTKYHRSGTAFYVPSGANQLLYSPDNFTDWVDQDSFTLGDRLSDIAFATDEVGYAIGGVNLYVTTDRGANWVIKSVGSSLRELGILPNGDVVVMTDQDVLVSSDQGDSFSDLFAAGMVPSISDNPDIMTIKPGGDIYFFAPNSGYLSTDGGVTFTRADHSLGYFATAIFFVDDDYGYVVDRNRKFATTTDGGLTWQAGADVPAGPEALFFTARGAGWMSSVNRRYETTDGGVTWTNAADNAGGYDFIRRAADGAVYAARWGANALVRSADDGATWTELAHHCFDYRTMAFTPDERYAFVAGDGFIVRHDLDELVSSREVSRRPALSLRAYPNPVEGQVWLVVPATNEPAGLAVFDMSGREVVARTVAAGQERIELDLRNLPRGVYVARWSAANGMTGRVRLVKQ